jgi:hypothetical protein
LHERHGNARNHGPFQRFRRHARHVGTFDQIANEHEARFVNARHVHDAYTPHLDLAGDRLGRPYERRSVPARFDEDLIVTADSAFFAEWHLGRIEWADALGAGKIAALEVRTPADLDELIGSPSSSSINCS